MESAVHSHRTRMTVWCLLVLASIAIFVSLGTFLFFEPGHQSAVTDAPAQALPVKK